MAVWIGRYSADSDVTEVHAVLPYGSSDSDNHYGITTITYVMSCIHVYRPGNSYYLTLTAPET